jgi:branched-chain amino acid transport system substrate-binding protein
VTAAHLACRLPWKPASGFCALIGRTAGVGATRHFALCAATGEGVLDGKQWTQPLMHYIVFELVADIIKRTTNIDDKEAIITAVKATDLKTLAGPVSWKGGKNNPVPNVSITPLVSSQWVKVTDYKYDIVVVANSLAPEVPVQAEVQPLKWA